MQSGHPFDLFNRHVQAVHVGKTILGQQVSWDESLPDFRKNIMHVSQVLGNSLGTPELWVHMAMIGNGQAIVTDSGPFERQSGWPLLFRQAAQAGDTIITRRRGVAIGLMTAYQPVLVFFHPPTGQLALASATLDNLWQESEALSVIDVVFRELRVPPAECAVWFGGGLGPCCFVCTDVSARLGLAYQGVVSDVPAPKGSLVRLKSVDMNYLIASRLSERGCWYVDMDDTCTWCGSTTAAHQTPRPDVGDYSLFMVTIR